MKKLISFLILFVLLQVVCVSAQLNCSKISYGETGGYFEKRWFCVEEKPTGGDWHAQVWLPSEGGSYPEWKIVVDEVSGISPRHLVTVSCYHDDGVFPNNLFEVNYEHKWLDNVNINSNYVYVASVEMIEGDVAHYDPHWYSSDCPNAYYLSHKNSQGVHQAQVLIGWFVKERGISWGKIKKWLGG